MYYNFVIMVFNKMPQVIKQLLATSVLSLSNDNGITRLNITS